MPDMSTIDHGLITSEGGRKMMLGGGGGGGGTMVGGGLTPYLARVWNYT